MQRKEITDRYLEALGLERTEPTAALLSRIVRAHVATFAFSSMGPRLGDELPLDLASLFDRIVVRGRGGYCFEQNGLLFEILQELGFAVRLQLARVVHNRDIHPGLTHRVTLVEVDGRTYVADVGFGPLGPPHPVPMPRQGDAGAGAGAGVPFRVVGPEVDQYRLQTLVDGEPYSLYRFELAQYGQSDCELGHFYSHRHPDATFVNTLVGSLILDDEVRSLRGRDYRVIRPDGETRTPILDDHHLRAVLEGELGLRVGDEECRRLFEGTSPEG